MTARSSRSTLITAQRARLTLSRQSAAISWQPTAATTISKSTEHGAECPAIRQTSGIATALTESAEPRSIIHTHLAAHSIVTQLFQPQPTPSTKAHRPRRRIKVSTDRLSITGRTLETATAGHGITADPITTPFPLHGTPIRSTARPPRPRKRHGICGVRALQQKAVM